MSTDPAPYPVLDGTQPCAAEPEAFFFNGEQRNNQLKIARAVETCTDCPFRRPCLAYALTHDVHGIWGGTTDGQRIALQRQHGIEPEPLRIGTPPRDLPDQVRALHEEGYTNAAIADLLDLEVTTVRTANHTAWYRDTDYARTRRTHEGATP